MEKKVKIFKNSRSIYLSDFKPYYEKENDFRRLAVLQSIAAFVISPIFCFFIYNSSISITYFNIGISYTILFPVYMILCYFVKSLSDKLIYFFIAHLFGITFFAFRDLVAHEFALIDFFSFYALYAVVLYVMQRLYPAIIYNFYVLSMLLYGFQYVDNPGVSLTASFGLFLVIALCSVVVLLSRQKMINSVEDYSNYLKKIVNNPGVGYVLFRFVNGRPILVDYNQESLRILNCEEQNIELRMLETIDKKEIDSIEQLKIGGERSISVLLKSQNETRALEYHFSVIFLKNGLYCLLRVEDITKEMKEKEIVESLKEKEVLLKEIHHRVKNNLQVISSILNLQSSFVKDKQTLEILEESRNRIRSMAIIHENLYRTTNFSSINFSDYLKNLTSNLIASYQVNTGKVTLKENLSKVDLVLDQAIPCGLLVNELITNSLKYAFVDGRPGEISIILNEIKNNIHLSISDNGVGLPIDFDILNSDTLGLQLVSTLVEQLDGQIVVDNSIGIKYLITFEKAKL